MLKRRAKPEIDNMPAAGPASPPIPLARMHRPRDVAGILAVSATTLRNWRQHGKGPRFIIYPTNVVRYPDDALRAWIREASGAGPVPEAGAR